MGRAYTQTRRQQDVEAGPTSNLRQQTGGGHPYGCSQTKDMGRVRRVSKGQISMEGVSTDYKGD